MFDSDSDTPPPKKGRIYMGVQQFCPHSFFVLSTIQNLSDFIFISRFAGLKQRLAVNSNLYKSPPSSYTLPTYAEHIARQFIRAPSPVLVDNTRYRPSDSVFRFLDFEADQCDQHFSGASPSTQSMFCCLHFHPIQPPSSRGCYSLETTQCHLLIVSLSYLSLEFICFFPLTLSTRVSSPALRSCASYLYLLFFPGIIQQQYCIQATQLHILDFEKPLGRQPNLFASTLVLHLVS